VAVADIPRQCLSIRPFSSQTEARPGTDTVTSTSPPSDITDTLTASPSISARSEPGFKSFGDEPSRGAASAIVPLPHRFPIYGPQCKTLTRRTVNCTYRARCTRARKFLKQIRTHKQTSRQGLALHRRLAPKPITAGHCHLLHKPSLNIRRQFSRMQAVRGIDLEKQAVDRVKHICRSCRGPMRHVQQGLVHRFLSKIHL